MRQLFRRMAYVLQRRRFEADLAEELPLHRELAARELQERGHDAVEARLGAPRAFSSAALASGRARDVWMPRVLQGLGQDLRFAARSLLQARLVAAAAIVSLALGIGATTALFSLLNGLALRSLPVAEPHRLALVSSRDTMAPGVDQWTMPTWEEIRKHAALFDGAFAWSGFFRGLTIDGEIESQGGMSASGDTFAILGVRPVLGRIFTADDDRTGRAPVVLIGSALWQRRFGGAGDVIGRSIAIDGVAFTVVGVMPPGFAGLEVGRAVDFAIPLAARRLIAGTGTAELAPSTRWLRIIVRLKPGQTLASATAALRAVQPQIRAAAMPTDFPQIRGEFLKDPFVLVTAAQGVSQLRRRYERPLVAMLAALGVLLIVACANIANLLLARAAARRHELGIRRALGASAWRLARQQLTESALLAVTGAAAGLVFAQWASRALVAALATGGAPIVIDVSIDFRVLAFTAIVTGGVTLLFGVAPAVRTVRLAPAGALTASVLRGGSGRGGVSNALVVAQLTLSLMLVTAAALFARSFARLTAVPLGFDADRLLLATVDVTHAGVAPPDRAAFYQQAAAVAAHAPGVARAAGSMMTPIGGGSFAMYVDLASAPRRSAEERFALVNFVTPGWFATYGIALRAGRDIDEHDDASSEPVMLVNDAFVDRFVTDGEPLGRTVTLGMGPRGAIATPSRTIVGTVTGSVYRSLRERVQPTMYIPLAQWPIRQFPLIPTVYIAVRPIAGSPLSAAASVRRALLALNRGISITFRPLSDQIDNSLAQDRMLAWMSAFFGSLALALAAIGLYGVTAYGVVRRRREIAIRIAVGATPRSVVGLILANMTRVLGAGLLAGGLATWWTSQLVGSLLFGTDPRGAATRVFGAVVLVLVAVLAALVPARRAAAIDPAIVLRCE